ncbi:MAG: glucan biosynthesis protein [Rhodobacteraceae bacterium]|nr:glucan biosynthesis protein [Paracoccaceae bacterium]
MDRRTLLRSALAGVFGSQIPLLAGIARGQEAPGEPFGFQTVIDRARAKAQAPFVRPLITFSEPFDKLKYDQFRGIRFREEERLFTDGQGFQMDLMSPGFYYTDRVEVNIVAAGMARPLEFSTDFFDFHPDYFPYPDGRAPAGLAEDHGFSGIRFRHPINRPGVWDEVAVFQGASYFRAVAHDTFYGLSARGLAIGTAGPDPEEFPLFTAFWVEEPAPAARVLKLHALLDSASVAGAYAFTITPGDETVMEIESVLFPRADIATLGVAPLTSMYFFGPESRRGVDDFRDAVHDSCGLRMINGAGERIWRPLRNPEGVEVSSFADENPRSFGLIQRFRDFEHFQDAEARYEQRPSAWIEPRGDWGPGAVLLAELPTVDEITDNIVTFWRPAEPLRAGSEHAFNYRLVWGQLPGEPLPIARVIATRSGRAILVEEEERVFVVDFDLGMINFETVQPVVRTSAGEVKGVSVTPLPGGNIARIGFTFVPGAVLGADFRLALVSEGQVASEVWLYRWTA